MTQLKQIFNLLYTMMNYIEIEKWFLKQYSQKNKKKDKLSNQIYQKNMKIFTDKKIFFWPINFFC